MTVAYCILYDQSHHPLVSTWSLNSRQRLLFTHHFILGGQCYWAFVAASWLIVIAFSRTFQNIPQVCSHLFSCASFAFSDLIITLVAKNLWSSPRPESSWFYSFRYLSYFSHTYSMQFSCLLLFLQLSRMQVEIALTISFDNGYCYKF